MLGLNTISIDIKKIKYPVYFEHRNICVHFSAEGSLVFVDKFGNEFIKELGIFEHIKCTRCKRIYSIRWDRDQYGTMKPSAIDFSIANQFSHFINSTSSSPRILQ